jgi:leucyl aminopeptidase (aminopeptidase T)
MSDLQRAVETVVGPCLGVKAGEDVVIVVDRTTRVLGDALRDAAAALGAEPVMTVMEPRDVDGEEPPAAVAAALAAARVFIAPTRRSLSHTRARKAASDAGARGATLPGVTEDMLARLMACDFPTMTARSRAVAELLTGADRAHVTCPLGSDFTVDLSGRTGIADDGDLSAEGAFGNLPCGEGFISPLTGEGTLVAATLASLGIPEEPTRLTVRDGRLADTSGEWGERWAGLMDAAGEQGRNLPELGVGTNERAMLTGNILEDEKMLGTVHVAFGASAGIGGTVAVPVHLDCLIEDATLDVGDTRVLDAGRFVL